MSPMQEFTTSTPTEADRPTAEFLLDGVQLAARRPKGAALLDLAMLAENSSAIAQVQAAKQFIDDCLTPESREHINSRLYDPEDAFDFDDLTAILEWVTEEFTRPARPTTPSSESSVTRRRTGRPSTAPVRSLASTPATSTLDAS